MDAVEEKPTVRRRKDAVVNGEAPPTLHWWDWRWVHPMTDDEFVAAFATWIFAKSPDHSVRQVRARLIYFVTHYMAQELTRSLAAYREEHPHDPLG